MLPIIIFLLVIYGLFLSLILWIVGAFVETKIYGGEAYYENLPDGFTLDDYFERKKYYYSIIAAALMFIGASMVYIFSDAGFFTTLLRSIVVCGIVFCFYIFTIGYNPFRNRPEPEQAIKKRDSAEGIGTLLGSMTPTTEFGKPLVLYVEDTSKENPELEALRVTNEDRGIILGAPGSGKTTYLVSQLVDWMRSGQSFVVTDVKPEIWGILKDNGIFEQYGYKDWVFNPTDTASDHYNLFSEVKDSAEFNEVLNIIVPDAQNDDASVFNDNARRLLKAVLMELGDKASLPNAQRFVNSMDDNAELLKTLRQSDNETVSAIAKDISRTAKNENLLASIMTAVSKAFDFLDDNRIRETIGANAQGFYLKEVLMKPKQAVFLQFDQQYKNTTATLFGAMVAHTMRILQANQKRGAVFLALDEIINCAPIPKFTDLLNTIRSANMPTFLYLQSLEGLNRIYGVNADRLFLGSSNFKVVFKIGDISTAELFSKLIGQTEATYTGYSSSRGDSTTNTATGSSSGWSESSGSSESTKLEYIVQPEEFIKLAPHVAVITYNGTFGTLEMPKYWEYFHMPERMKNARKGDLVEVEGV